MSSSQKHLPYFAEGTVVSGFGRGSKELGIPTANFPDSVIQNLPSDFECGVYYGWAKVDSDENVYKMVMCVGWNPYYHNTVKTMETHIIHQFDSDFYGDHLKVIVLGYIRPMCNFESLDALISAIHKDIDDAIEHLKKPEFLHYSKHPYFSQFPPTLAPVTEGPPTVTPISESTSTKVTPVSESISTKVNPTSESTKKEISTTNIRSPSSSCHPKFSQPSNYKTHESNHLNGDLHGNHHRKADCPQNGLVATVVTDPIVLENVHHIYSTGGVHCEDKHDSLARHSKDAAHHFDGQKVY